MGRIHAKLISCLVPAAALACAHVAEEPDGVPDTYVDTGSEVALDSEPDTVADTGSDTGFDTGFDAGLDTGFDTGFDTGWDSGIDTGFDTGWDTGWDPGWDTGYDPGWDTGWDPGWDTGYDPGWDTGYDPGWDTGYDPGWDTGYDTGWDTGYDPGFDTGFDTGFDPGTDPGITWGVPICGSSFTIPDRATRSSSVVIPSLGDVRVMQLDITVDDRTVFFKLPFDDLVMTLTSPAGVDRVFWKNFIGDEVSVFPPNWDVPGTWQLPVWWMTPVGGTWTLEVDDTMLTLTSTTVSRWCLTPLDPALHASHPTGATISRCASDTGSIPDCDMVTPDCPGVATYEMQVTDLVRASSARLTLGISHADHSQLRVVMTFANGVTTTLWDRGTGTIPSTITLSGLTGDWVTGRYQLLVEDHVDGTTGSVTSWCIGAN